MISIFLLSWFLRYFYAELIFLKTLDVCLLPLQHLSFLADRYPPHLHHSAAALKIKYKEHLLLWKTASEQQTSSSLLCEDRHSEKDSHPPTHPTNLLSTSLAVVREGNSRTTVEEQEKSYGWERQSEYSELCFMHWPPSQPKIPVGFQNALMFLWCMPTIQH